MNWTERIINYIRETGFPNSLFIADDGRVVGTRVNYPALKDRALRREADNRVQEEIV